MRRGAGRVKSPAGGARLREAGEGATMSETTITGGSPMCRMFAGQPPETYESETRSIRLHGHCTSIRLERAFWATLDDIAGREGLSTSQFIAKLHDEVLDLHGEARNFASLLRCACLVHLRDAQAPRAMAAE
jgi:predicted DNA-binding ribbon-helix-helix protein